MGTHVPLFFLYYMIECMDHAKSDLFSLFRGVLDDNNEFKSGTDRFRILEQLSRRDRLVMTSFGQLARCLICVSPDFLPKK